jgi:hypothetical protein
MTGALKTAGAEGAMQKGIILTTNDLLHPTTVANLAIRFAVNGQGLRIKGGPTSVRLRQDALRALVTVENCEPDKPILIEAIELPEGWSCQQPLPVTVRAEDRASVPLTRKLEGGAVAPAFEALPFVLVTDSAKTPRVQGTLTYRPEISATPVSAPTGAPAAGGGAPAVRWPMAKPAPLVVPVTAPGASVSAPTAGSQAPADGPAAVPAAATEAAAPGTTPAP